MNIKEILAKLVSFNTVRDKDNAEIIGWVEAFLSERGFKTEKIIDTKTGKMNLFAKYGDKKETGLTFFGHTDTVPVGGNWTYEPFALTVEGDNLYGLGTSDMKGGIAAFLDVVNQIDLSSLDKNIEAVFTFDEEYGFGGINSFLDNKKINSDVVVIGEPTNNNLVVATKGVFALKIDFLGKSVHSSNPQKGENSILKAVKLISEVNKYYQEKLMNNKNELFNPSYTTFNVGLINGGDAVNKVPEKCSIELEWRTIFPDQKEEITKELERIISENEIRCDIEEKLVLEPMICCDNFKNEISSVLEKVPASENYATEGSYLPADKNVIILGPGPMNAHIADEFVSEKSLLDTVNEYKKLIKKYC